MVSGRFSGDKDERGSRLSYSEALVESTGDGGCNSTNVNTEEENVVITHFIIIGLRSNVAQIEWQLNLCEFYRGGVR